MRIQYPTCYEKKSSKLSMYFFLFLLDKVYVIYMHYMNQMK